MGKMPNRIEVTGEYCPFHPKISVENRHKIMFVHGRRKEGDEVRFFKVCPKCLKTFFYDPKIISTPSIDTNV